MGDLDGDGVVDLAVGARLDDDGGRDRGAVWLLFLHRNGTVKTHQKISDVEGGFSGGLKDLGRFGSSVANAGDLDGDGFVELGVGANRDGDNGRDRGAVWILFLGSPHSRMTIATTDVRQCPDTLQTPLATVKLAWIRAAEQLIRSYASSFSLLSLSLTKIVHNDDSTSVVDIIPATFRLRQLFPTNGTTWVLHDDATYSSEFLAKTTVCSNLIWVHRPLTVETLRRLWVTPYMFDFLLVSEREFDKTAFQCPSTACERLVRLLGMAKVIVVAPSSGSGLASAWWSGLSLNSTIRALQRGIDDAIRHHVVALKVSVRVGDTGLVSVHVEKLLRHARHHFDDEFVFSEFVRPRCYDVRYRRSRSWTPELLVRRQISGKAGLQTFTPTPIKGTSKVEFAGRVFAYTSERIPLTRLAMVNVALIIGMQPSHVSKLILWDMYFMAYRYPTECGAHNYCFDSGSMVYCDRHFTPDSESKRLWEAPRSGRLRCYYHFTETLFNLASLAWRERGYEPKWKQF